ncbi:NAD-binding protein, partial [Guyparkeria sp. 1SP6A2]|nr:NAD-binding protein [Guyparkeria sp. 1SP6A2]
VAIIGSGLVGCEFANDLHAGGHRVALVAPEPAPLARLLPEPLGRALGEAMAEAGIVLRGGRSLTAIEAEAGGMALGLDNGQSLRADL